MRSTRRFRARAPRFRSATDILRATSVATKRERAVRELRQKLKRAVAKHRRTATAETWFTLGTILAEAYSWSRDVAHELRAAEGLDDSFDPIACWKRCVKLAPKHAKAWHLLGATYVELDDAENAVRALTRAVKLDPRVASAWNALAILTMPAAGDHDLARVKRAERYLRRAIEADPRGKKLGWEPYAWLAEAAERRRDDPGALAWYAEANRRGDRYAAARKQVIEDHGARRRPTHKRRPPR
jgi:tetratricopeptide (TPR) repeat protein